MIYYVIEAVIRPGSFYSREYNNFKGYTFASLFTTEERALEVVKEDEIELCKITKIYEK